MEDRLNPCNYNLLRAAAAVRIQPRRSFQISRLSSSVGIHCELLGRAIGCDILFLFTLSLYFLSKDKIFLSCLAYALSFVKPEPIVLLPVYAAIVTFHFKERRERHFALKAIRSLIYVAGLVLLLNVAIILYPPWLSGYISLIQYRDKASMATDALTSLHEFVWLYPIPIISFAYVWQSTKPIAKQKLQSLEYNYGPLG